MRCFCHSKHPRRKSKCTFDGDTSVCMDGCWLTRVSVALKGQRKITKFESGLAKQDMKADLMYTCIVFRDVRNIYCPHLKLELVITFNLHFRQENLSHIKLLCAKYASLCIPYCV